MNGKSFINRYFRKSKAVKILIHFPDHRVRTYYTIPKGDQITVSNGVFKLDLDNVFYDEKRFPTYLYSFKDVRPINALTGDSKKDIDPTELFIQSENKLVNEFIKGMGGGLDINMIMLVLMIVLLGVSGFGLFTLYNEVGEIKEILGGFINV